MSHDLHPLSDVARNFRPGLYRHYKGGTYRAWFVARGSEERHEEFVVYQSLEKGYVWVRPLAMFFENVEMDGKSVARFERIGE